ncbi:Flp family type IVb pilin [Novosphingobium album (ex Liu et al. 2023)]|uniref:Flp family type IVb pilin n=1 Tax=Novosphingobium album (ex Liu et al. 2023) TaxID=3031130 RepID=A0ABT5WKE9_9SPHN|nr:Flp family type IVb pilin [Novosphingobium album (ex Liu et al. 2023)]MDE8650506.1 Flp family type IVb pilin [Novosphingobium album (ex Liu et al. 2023)]
MLDYTRTLITSLIRDEDGLTAVEYAVLGAIVVAAIVAVGTQFNTDLAAAFGNLFSQT